VLVALLVLTLGIAALARLQLWLWTTADLARQLDEARHAAEGDLDAAQGWLRLTGAAPSFATLDSLPAAGLAASTSTAYQAERRVTALADGAGTVLAKAVSSHVRWTDREGEPRELALHGLVAGLDPFWSGASLLPRPGQRADGLDPAAGGRHPALPPDARSLGTRGLVWKLDAASDLAWVFDPRSGRVLERCSGSAGISLPALTDAQLQTCVAVAGLALWGVVRFATESASPGAAEALDPPSAALDLDLVLTLSQVGSPPPGWVCEDNASSASAAALRPGAVRYLCLVQPGGTPPAWSGRLDLLPRGWVIGSAAPEALRVCRYSSDSNGNGRIDNAEHPALYDKVDGPLGHQNFLVVPLAATCPATATGADLEARTVAHQP
jgi:hypothetical protein